MQTAKLLDRGLAALAKRLVVPWYSRRFQQFVSACQRTQELQRSILWARIQQFRESRFGRDHGFATMRTIDDFRCQVPVSGYERFAPYVDAVAGGEHTALLPASERLVQFTITTGTTGTPKLNPVTTSWLREYVAAWDLWNIKLILDHQQVVGRKILQLSGTWDMGRTPAGHQISMVSALMSRNARKIVRRFYAVPQAVAGIPDPLARCYTILRLTMTQDIGLIVAISPGALLRMAELGNMESQTLIRDIHDGKLSDKFDIPAAIRRELAPHVSRPAQRDARRLEGIVGRSGGLYPRDYWSSPVVTCWLGGTAGFQSRALPEYFGRSPLRDLGLVASEGRHTIPLDDGQPAGVLAVNTNYYEFASLADGTANRRGILEAHELDIGGDYSLVMSTAAGFFRYEIGDVVRCRGYVGTAPILEFVQKVGRCGDLEGEKLTEHQVAQAVHEVAAELNLLLNEVTAVPCRPAGARPCYVLLAEKQTLRDDTLAQRFLDAVDRRLAQANFLYNGHRRAGILGGLRLWRLPEGSWSAYQRAELARRQTGDTQYKHPALVADTAILERFQPVDVLEVSPVGNQAAA